MRNEYSAAAYYTGNYDEAAIQEWARATRAQLKAPRVSLGLVFLGARFYDQAASILELLRLHAQIPLLAGCSGAGLIEGAAEIEDEPGIALALYAMPGAELKGVHFTQDQVEEAQGPAYWHVETGVGPGQSQGWLVFADPFHLDSERWLQSWNEAWPDVAVIGGLASGNPDESRAQVYLNGDVFEEGGVAVRFAGEVELACVVSQGCTPIGDTWTITRAERNLIHQIGNRPAYEVLVDTFNHLSSEDQGKTRGNVLVGLVINEYLEDFHRGDFLVRSLLGADPKSGTMAVGAFPRLGQTMQFQRRDAAAATEDLIQLLDKTKKQLRTTKIYGGCLCCCNGRGQHLFNAPDHDARLVQQYFGPMGLAGFFCNGEIGPVGNRNFLHGYTASLALFVKKSSEL
jgi:small ligand-binding sensory domain FIST